MNKRDGKNTDCLEFWNYNILTALFVQYLPLGTYEYITVHKYWYYYKQCSLRNCCRNVKVEIPINLSFFSSSSIHAAHCAAEIDCEICIDSISLIIYAHHSFRLCQFHFVQDHKWNVGLICHRLFFRCTLSWELIQKCKTLIFLS